MTNEEAELESLEQAASSYWQADQAAKASSEPAASTNAEKDEPNFTNLTSRLGENLAQATLRLVDASHDFTGLIQAYVAAGQQLERSLEIVRELANASQRALNDAREAASEAAHAASEAKQAQESSVDLIQRSTSEHLALAELTENLRQRISALAVLGAPMPTKDAASSEGSSSHDWQAA